RVVRMRPIRRPAPGHSTVGVSALSFLASLPAQPDRSIVCRGDSGADISLISEEFLQGLPSASRPVVRQGLKMQLYQLTGNAKITGYVNLSLVVQSREGPQLQFAAECYVVPGMTVPLLLGEDFHLNYELGVTRSVADGSLVSVGSSGFSFASFVKARAHRRNKGRKRRQVDLDRHPVALVKTQVRIPPFTTALVSARFNSSTTTDWYLEKTVLGQVDGSFLVTTPTVFSTADARVSVANTTARWQTLRAGDVLGR
ncbi:hypothetical protein BV25DRAFT_1770150, partial [Artomyces pyxidatus]